MQPRLRSSVIAVLAAAAAGCGDGGCNPQPLPGGELPADQTVEGGGQIRITDAGFEKLTALIPGAINDLVDDGICVPKDKWGDPDGDWGTGTYYCDRQTGGACGTSLGCDVDFHVDYIDMNVPDTQHSTIAVQLDLDTVVHLTYQSVPRPRGASFNRARRAARSR